MKIHTIDCDYVFSRFAASFILTEAISHEAVFVENNTARSIPKLLESLRELRIPLENVRYLIVTHVHLDHAGGSQMLMDACPNAVLLAHPRAVPHLVDPSKLVSSARKVYGDREFERLYGQIGPIDPARVRAMADGESIQWGEMHFQFIHTRGHANHHFCVLVSDSSGDQVIFTGDSFGLAYPDLQKHGLFVFPSTSPTDFDPGEARKSIDRIANSGARRAFLTHFGAIEDLQGAARMLLRYLDAVEPFFRSLIESEAGERPQPELNAQGEKLIRAVLENEYRALGGKPGSHFWELLKLDIELNAAGMVFAALKKRNRARSG